MRYRILTNILPLMIITALSSCTDSGTDDQHKNGVMGAGLENIEKELLPGALLTRKQCGSCHSIEDSSTKVGPSLKGVFGRAPRISGVPYAVWNEKALDAWIENPTKVKARTAMSIPGIKSADERATIIEYLRNI